MLTTDRRADCVASARDHYQRCLQAYLAATDEATRRVRGIAMQNALRMTLETRQNV